MRRDVGIRGHSESLYGVEVLDDGLWRHTPLGDRRVHVRQRRAVAARGGRPAQGAVGRAGKFPGVIVNRPGARARSPGWHGRAAASRTVARIRRGPARCPAGSAHRIVPAQVCTRRSPAERCAREYVRAAVRRVPADRCPPAGVEAENRVGRGPGRWRPLPLSPSRSGRAARHGPPAARAFRLGRCAAARTVRTDSTAHVDTRCRPCEPGRRKEPYEPDHPRT